MKKIEAIIRLSKLDDVLESLHKIGIDGLTLADVKGTGKQHGVKEVYRGIEIDVKFLSRIKLEIVLEDTKVDEVINTILKIAHIGKSGDGRIFVYNIEKAFNITTKSEIKG